MSDYDRENWQVEQIARDEAQGTYRDKMARARERSAANAKRKIARLHAKLTELGHISDFEDEFGESVLERLDTYGSAFHDREKGRAGDALTLAQKQVVARMNKKLKDLKAKQRANEGIVPDPDADYVRTADRWKQDKASQEERRNGFKSKRKPKFTPRVRHIEDDIIEEPSPRPSINAGPPKLVPKFVPKLVSAAAVPQSRLVDETLRAAPYIPKYVPDPTAVRAVPNKASEVKPSGAKRPFLRLVSKP